MANVTQKSLVINAYSVIIQLLQVGKSICPQSVRNTWYVPLCLASNPFLRSILDQLYCNIATKRIELQKNYFINI